MLTEEQRTRRGRSARFSQTFDVHDRVRRGMAPATAIREVLEPIRDGSGPKPSEVFADLDDLLWQDHQELIADILQELRHSPENVFGVDVKGYTDDVVQLIAEALARHAECLFKDMNSGYTMDSRDPDGYGYLRKRYGVNPRVGAQVKLHDGSRGTVVPAAGSFSSLHVVREGTRAVGLFHPRDIEWLPEPPRGLTADEMFAFAAKATPDWDFTTIAEHFTTIAELVAETMGRELPSVPVAPDDENEDQDDEALDEAREPWQLTADEFTGPAIIDDQYTIDGRRDEDYTPIWSIAGLRDRDDDDPDEPPAPDAVILADDCALRWPVWTGDGYAVREIKDFEPEGTFVLVAPDRSLCGFYMDAQVWVDPAHRGKGLSSRLILAAADFHGGSPTRNTMGLGFSEAGYRAHLAAHRLAVAEARAEGKPVPQDADEEQDLAGAPAP